MFGFKRVIAAAIALGLLVAGLSCFLLFNQVSTLAHARAWVLHSRAVIEASQQLSASIGDAAQSERGYLITGAAAYIPPLERASDALPSEESQLLALVADNPAQIGVAKGLVNAIEARRAAIDRVLALARTGDLAAARAVEAAGSDRPAMIDIRARTDAVTRAEAEYLSQRTATMRDTQTVSLAVGLAVSFVALATLVLGVIVLAGANRRLVRAAAARREAEAARAAQDALTAAIFANAPDYLFVLNVEDGDRFVLADVNPAFAKAAGVPPERVRGRDVRELLPPDVADQMLRHYRRVHAAGHPITSRDELNWFPGGSRTWEAILAPVPGGGDAGDRIIGSVRDITDRVHAEARLREAQRMEAIGQLTGGVAHDFNNLLQVIRGNLELLEGAVASNERATERLKNALYGADRAAQLTRQLLAFARRQPLAPQVINLSRLISDMADLLRRTLGEAIEVETIVAGGLWNTMADPAQVESALLNLALNARDAMPSGGRLTVEITNAVLDEAYVRDARDVEPGQYVMLAVSDTGQGMSEETQAHVFEPFFTTKAEGKGTGLGLSMVYGFVKQSDGHIQIYSEVGHGTTVKIYLPRSRQDVARPPPRVSGPTAETLGRTILVVEDEEAVRAAAVSMLDELGYRCVEAGDAQSALRVLEGGDAAIDLVFTDVVMPGPITAREFAQRLRSFKPGMPILFTSGYTDNAILHHGRLDEDVQLISKPYARAELAQKLAQMLSAPAAA